jgi:hypothetical protein
VGTLGAWYETVVLLGDLPVGAMLLGMLLTSLYLAFAVAVTAAASSFVRHPSRSCRSPPGSSSRCRSSASSARSATGCPSVLLGSLVGLTVGVPPVEYLRPTLVTLAATAGLLWLATARLVFGVWLNRRPRWELRISPDEIALVTPRGATARIGRAEADGRVAVRKRVDNGRAWFSLVAPALPDASGIPLDGFPLEPGALAAACAANGWTLAA